LLAMTSLTQAEFQQLLSHFQYAWDQVVLENNNAHLTRLSAEGLSLVRALLSPRQEVVLGPC
jgi:hypothetical protein